MTIHHDTPELLKPLDILAHCTELMPTDKAYIEHKLIQRFGSPDKRFMLMTALSPSTALAMTVLLFCLSTMGILSLFNVL